MRINVYSQEFTSEVELISKESDGHDDTGKPIVYHAVRLILHSSPRLHHSPLDDDHSAVTFWLPKSPSRRDEMVKAFERMAELIRKVPSDSGLD